MSYSPALDGLRAIAVLAVVLYHLDVPGVAGGFVGVDMFFVISGYLITSLIRARLDTGAFRLRDFYLRRVVRLLPALIATVLATAVAAAVLLTPWDFRAFARSAVGALFSASNIVFYLEAGYWDSEAALKPLLHTWSLGVEEQFYLAWPLLLLGLATLGGHRRQRLLMAVLLLLSALATISMTRLDAAAAFYLVPFRVFQFAAGALISFVPVAPGAGSRPLAVGLTVAGVLGLGTLAVSVTVLDADRVSYPGIWALLPTAGTVLVLLATTGFRHDRSSLLRAPLESVPLVFLGRISYSLYLVHWPVVALYRYRYGPPEGLALPALATLMLLLALLLHSQVERRFYRRAGEPGAASGHRAGGPGLPQTAMGIGLLLVASGAVLASAWAGDGWAWRRPGLRLDPATIEAGMQRRYAHLDEACRLAAFRDGPCGEPYDRRVLVLGNSLEPDGYNFLRAATGNPPGLQFVLFGTTNRCAELRVAEGVPLSSTAECQQRLDRLFSPQFLNTLDAVFYASNRPYAPNKAPVLDLLRELKRRRPALAVGTLGGYINTVRDCSYYMSEYGMPDACLEPSRVRVFVADRTTRPLYAAFRELEDLYVDRVGLLCEERKLQNCAYATREGVPMMYDRVHSSLEFAEFTGSLYRRRHGDALLQGLGLAGG